MKKITLILLILLCITSFSSCGLMFLYDDTEYDTEETTGQRKDEETTTEETETLNMSKVESIWSYAGFQEDGIIHLGDTADGWFNVRTNDIVSESDFVFICSDEKIATVKCSKVSNTRLYECHLYFDITSISAGECVFYAQSSDGKVKSEEIKITVVENGEIYICNLSNMKFHLASCSYSDNIVGDNRFESKASRELLIKYGYIPCSHCNP